MRLTCVIDNSVQRGSALWGEHGLCFWVQAGDLDVLWDTGQTPAVLNHNLPLLGLEAHEISAIGCSHAHNDHAGALLDVLTRHRGTPVYANASLFEPRFSRSGDRMRSIGLQPEPAAWRAAAEFRLSDEPQQMVPGVTTTGKIAPRPYPEGSSRGHAVERDGVLCPDPYADDMSLVLEVAGGLVLLCGCCHAGLRNTLALVRARYSEPLLAIVGGTHLADATEGEFGLLIETLRGEGSPRLYLNHCTGERALFALHRVFADQMVPCPAGTVIDFP